MRCLFASDRVYGPRCDSSSTKTLRNTAAKYYRGMARSSMNPKTGRVQNVEFEVGHQVWVPVKTRKSVMNMSATIVAFGRNVKGTTTGVR